MQIPRQHKQQLQAQLPADTQQQSQQTAVDAGAADAQLDRAKVLVVDDRPANLLVTKTVLDELGHQIVTASSGEEALKRVLEDDFAVILLDVNMPGMDGLETASYIRKRKKTAHIPIIFLTAYVEEMHTSRGYSLGAVDYILTPVLPDILRTKVSVFVQLDMMTRQVQRQAEQRIALAREQAARAVAEEAKQRSMILADAGDILGKSLETGATLKALAPFLVPTLADFAALVLFDEQKQCGQTEAAWMRTGGDGREQRSFARLLDPVLEEAVAEALSSQREVAVLTLKTPLTGVNAPGARQDDPPAADFGFALHTLAILPMAARGRMLGVVILGMGRGAPSFDPAAISLATDLADRAAISLDNCFLYAKIQEEDRRKNEFLAMLAHELRNPLAPIRNAVQILRLPALAKDKIDWARDVIDRQTLQLGRLVDDLLDVARVTQGRISLNIEAVDVAEVMKSAEEMTRPLIDSRKHSFALAAPPPGLTVRGDRARITQILGNLLHNAAKYSDPGGSIHLGVTVEGAEVVFRVKDTGIGIPREIQSSIFDLFTQANRSLDRSQGGLGIGLTIVRRLVELQGGSVSASSAGQGQGSEFTVRLPIAGEVAAGGAAAAPPLPANNVLRAAGSAYRVMVVDDYLDAAESMAAMLAVEGQEVNIAEDGYKAIELAKRFKPEIAFLDIGLPGISGFELARTLRQAPETRNCILIAVSGYGQANDHRLSAEAGFDRHLVKPVELTQLHEIFDTLAKNGAH